MKSDEIFDMIETTAHRMINIPIYSERYLRSLSFVDEETGTSMYVLDYIDTWCCVFSHLTEEQARIIEEAGYDIHTDEGVWSLGKKGDLDSASARELNKACEVFFSVLFTE